MEQPRVGEEMRKMAREPCRDHVLGIARQIERHRRGEGMHRSGARSLELVAGVAPEQAPAAFQRIGLDTWTGMALSNLVALAIMLTAGATLHASVKTDIDSAQTAAEALRPIAGEMSFLIFALGVPTSNSRSQGSTSQPKKSSRQLLCKLMNCLSSDRPARSSST